MPTLLRLLAVLTVVPVFGIALADSTPDTNIRVSDYLESLNRGGQNIIFSSDLVTDELWLESQATTDISRSELAELLQQFGLTVQAGPANSLLVVRSEPSADPVQVQPEPTELQPDALPEIVVTSSLSRIEYSRVGGSVILDRQLAARVPAAAEEAVRLPDRLPGTANGGISTRSHVRGGESNETLYLLDGLRLYEPFHLKDFQSVATVINANAISGMDFYSGAYPARFGDRMSAVMDIRLREPDEKIQTELAFSFFNTSALSLGRFGGNDKGDWLFAARRGNLDLIADVMNPDVGSPDYHDYLGHLGWAFGARADISVNVLLSTDKINLNDEARGEQATATYDNQVFWAKWDAEWNDMLRSSTVLSFTDIDDNRVGSVNLPDIVTASLEDRRKFRAASFKQDWVYVPSSVWMLGFGIDGKHLDGRYVFESARSLQAPFEQIYDNNPVDLRNTDLIVDGAQYAAYAELRWQMRDNLTIDVGMRWDHQSYTTAMNDEQSSPRISFLYQPNESTELRFGWGQFSQAQEVNELQVSDGLNSFFPAQRAEHVVGNLKHRFNDDINLELSVFRKIFRAVRPRFESAFNQLSIVPEIQFDRVMIDANSAESTGVELRISRGSGADDLFWWIGYSWSEVEDAVPGGKQKRSWDQTHTGKYGASWRWGSWDFSAAGLVHTGWPKNVLTLESSLNPDGSELLSLSTSEFNGVRHSVFHSLDVRVSRDFDIRLGDLKVFLEVTNLYGRENACCTEYSIGQDETGATVLESRTEHWLPLVPSLGVVWSF